MPNGNQPDYIAIAMVAALLIILVVLVIRKYIRNKKAGQVEAEDVAATPAVKKEPVLAPGSAGKIKLNGVEPKKAAMLMAIVANKTGRPLNELRFISIREVEE